MTIDHASTASSSHEVTTRRDEHLDFIKGLLVIGMVMYHVAGIHTYHDITWPNTVQFYLDFVSGSWVFITGVIIAVYYGDTFSTSRGKTSVRLWIRGLKLLAIFITLNFLVSYFDLLNKNQEFTLVYVYTMLVPGTGAASFEVLVGISYVLLISPFILFLGYFGYLSAAGIIITLVSIYTIGYKPPNNLWVVSCGAGGFLLGRLLLLIIRAGMREKLESLIMLAVTLIAVLAYFSAKYYLEINKYHIFVYLSGITCILGFCYILHTLFRIPHYLNEMLLLLGRYPLVGYIWQMVLIVLWRMFQTRINAEYNYFFNLLVVTSLLVVSIAILKKAQQKSALVKKAYRLLFM
jgi:hypothetical protein